MDEADASDRLLELAQTLVGSLEFVFKYDLEYTQMQLGEEWENGPLEDTLHNWANMETLAKTYRELRNFLTLINCDVETPEV